MKGSGKGPPVYPPRGSLAARASAAEAQPDAHGATGLDRPKFTDDTIARWPSLQAERDAARTIGGAPNVVEPSQRPPRRPHAAAWITIAVLGLVSGAAGAVLGVWLVLMG